MGTIDPKSHEYFQEGHAKMGKGNYKGAIDSFSKAINTSSNFWEAYLNRGV